jgi:hypothetical protein
MKRVGIIILVALALGAGATAAQASSQVAGPLPQL